MHLNIHLLLCDFRSLCYEGTVPSHQINIHLYFPSRFRQFHLSTSIFHPSDIYSGGGCCSVAKSCPTLCNPMDCSQPGSSVHGILQARILAWVAFSFSRGSSRPRDRTRMSCVSSLAGRFFTPAPRRLGWL